MNIGLIVDGRAEYYSLPALLRRVETANTVLSPLVADIQPWAPPLRIAVAVEPSLKLLSARADLVVILIDFEARLGCPGEWARELETALGGCCRRCGVRLVRVVTKVRTFENWLVADITALRTMRKRFRFAGAVSRKVAPDKADRPDAARLLKAAALGTAYDKIRDAKRIMALAEPLRIAENSRSFRRFLRVVGSPQYANQSAQP